MTTHIAANKPKFDEVLTHFKDDLGTLRTGRATAMMVENIPVQAYDSTMELKALASIMVPDAKTIVVDAWDKSLLREIEKAITDARIGANPVIDGVVIRLAFPPMTEESRKQVVKMAKAKLEEARIALRKLRETLREEILKKEEDGEMGQDERFRMQSELEEITKEFAGKLDEMAEEKEKDVMTI